MIDETLAWWLIIGAVGLIALSYLMARAASYAHFRTKLEFLRKLTQELGGEPNGNKE